MAVITFERCNIDRSKNCLQCGREFRPHCPSCGSYRHYGLASRKDRLTDNDGNVRVLNVYRCLGCGNVYNEDAWMFNCIAQPEQLGRPRKDGPPAQGRTQASAKLTEEDLPQHQKDILAQLRKMRGIEE